ncbi:U3 small nucleolar ribonucleoprotein protein MPP10 [Aphis gossypii]|uniref:U3 small nucleolar ribonucleoprotein protein MPP10 n=1 Tax=Aphis gossypii TaxID=80765 RepID=UPI0021594549|nr:U3 small nucleolar ribonucleoprotein protein MPP10 [Aphis gossypii]
MTNVDFIATFQKLTVNPLDYLDVQSNVAEETTNLLKQLYDTTKSIETITDNANDDALPELIVKDFDEEQIWQELELQNSARLKLLANTIQGFTESDLIYLDESNSTHTKKNLKITKSVNDETKINKLNKNNAELNSDEFENSEDLETDDEDNDNNEDDIESEDEDEDDIENEDEDNISDLEETEPSTNKKTFKKSVVDDEFFKLSEMENFLLSEEKLETSKEKSKPLEDDVDMFQDLQSENEEEDNFGPMYQDFFEKQTNVTKKSTKSKKNVRFEMDDEKSEDNEEETNELIENNNEHLSTLEMRSERINKRIAKLEEEAISDNKPWALKGEVAAKDRPQNSLLEEAVEFDVCTRPAPIITEETTVKLEDIILQRIKDKAWDDVERKIKQTNAPHEFKKQLVLNQEKSKESLSQIYEKEFIKQREAADPENKNKPEEEPKEHKEIDFMIKELFRKLDALTNYHYTPKQAIPDLKIVNNLPAISMEEVAPVATTDASLLAPEEIQRKFKAPVLGKEERTSTDKKRERRKKKHLQHKKRITKESNLKEMEKNGFKPKHNKDSAQQELKRLTSSGHQIKELKSVDDKSMKSSKDFFSRLQDQARNEIDGKKRIMKQSDRNNTKKFKK